MATPSTNYTAAGTQFSVPTGETEQTDITAFLINALNALEGHTHGATRGAAVTRIASCSVSAGNLTFATTGQRIAGDLSNATASSRLLFQSSTTDGNTRLGLIPNGTATISQVDLFNAADPDNAGRFRLFVSGATAGVGSAAASGTGVVPTTFQFSSFASYTFDAKVTTVASASGGAGLNLPHGAAPSAPVNGDVWTTTAGLFVRVNGATVGPLS